MRHRNKTAILGRKKSVRVALMRGLADSLITHGKIKTTLAKAKALRRVVEPVITKAKRGTLHDNRLIRQTLYTDTAVNKALNEIGPKYKERNGGYTRITKLGRRPNDAAEVAVIELV
jgi:large subunit ribosomal protein L17